MLTITCYVICLESMDMSSSQSTENVSKRRRDVSLINPGRARREQREACSVASVTDGSTGENDAQKTA